MYSPTGTLIKVDGSRRSHGTGEGIRCRFGTLGTCIVDDPHTTCPSRSKCFLVNDRTRFGYCCKEISRGKRDCE